VRRVVTIALLASAAALALASPAFASERHPSLNEIEGEVICPVCPGETIDQSDAAIALRMKAFIARRIAAGDTKSEIESKLAAEFGPAVIAQPSKHGFNLLAWLLPLVGIVAAGAVLGGLAWRWSRGRSSSGSTGEAALQGRGELDPEAERRLDRELASFD
jgi:cytochrome c-type biogenesis protein CcmH